jgi:putative endonuclease
MKRTRWQRCLLWLQRWWRGPNLGKRGEQAAERFLISSGYRLLHRNYKISGGELDLIMLDGRTVVFVEVKTRATAELGRPELAVDERKQQQLIRISAAYIKRYHLQHVSKRFDVVSVVWPETQQKPEIKHILHAFDAT